MRVLHVTETENQLINIIYFWHFHDKKGVIINVFKMCLKYISTNPECVNGINGNLNLGNFFDVLWDVEFK